MSRSIKIKGTTFGGSQPCVAAIIDRPIALADVKRLIRRGADLLEIRIDLFKGDIKKTIDYVKSLRKAVRVPLLGTVRETVKNSQHRLDIFNKLIPLVDIVDIEIDTPIRDQVMAAVKTAGKKVIVSEHDFKKTPPDTRLITIVTESKKAGADIVKIAAMANSSGDVVRMLDLCKACPIPMIAISMGEFGTISRVLAPLFGSLFTYGAVGKAVAPGQLPFDELVRELKRYYPIKQKRTHR